MTAIFTLYTCGIIAVIFMLSAFAIMIGASDMSKFAAVTSIIVASVFAGIAWFAYGEIGE